VITAFAGDLALGQTTYVAHLQQKLAGSHGTKREKNRKEKKDLFNEHEKRGGWLVFRLTVRFW